MHLDDGFAVGQNPLVCRLFKGVSQSRPPKPKYTELWDVQVFLTYLATLHPVDTQTTHVKTCDALVISIGPARPDYPFVRHKSYLCE